MKFMYRIALHYIIMIYSKEKKIKTLEKSSIIFHYLSSFPSFCTYYKTKLLYYITLPIKSYSSSIKENQKLIIKPKKEGKKKEEEEESVFFFVVVEKCETEFTFF